MHPSPLKKQCCQDSKYVVTSETGDDNRDHLGKTIHDDVIKGNIFRVSDLFAGNSPVTGEFPTQRPVTRSFGVFFDLRLNKRLSKQSWGWWFETPSRSLNRRCNGFDISCINSSPPGHHDRYFADDILQSILYGCNVLYFHAFFTGVCS